MFHQVIKRKTTTPANGSENPFVSKGYKQPLLSKKAKQFFAPTPASKTVRNLTSQPAPQSEAIRAYLSPDKLVAT